MRKKSFAQSLPLIAPVHILILSVIVIPSLLCGLAQPERLDLRAGPTFVGCENYVRVLADPAFHRALWNTVVIVVCRRPYRTGDRLGMALLFASGLPFRRFLLVAVLAPYAVSEVIAVAMWRFLFDPDVGPVTLALTALGLPTLDWSFEPSHALDLDRLADDLAAPALHLHHPLCGAAGDPRASSTRPRASTARRPMQAFRRVTLPLLGPAILVALLFRYIFAFRIFSEVWLLTQGGPARSTEVVAVYLYQEAFRFNAFGTAAATAWIMVVASLLLAAGYVLLLRKKVVGHAH